MSKVKNITCTKTHGKNCTVSTASTNSGTTVKPSAGWIALLFWNMLLLGKFAEATVVPSFLVGNEPVWYNSTIEAFSATNSSSAVDHAYQQYLNGSEVANNIYYIHSDNLYVTNVTFPVNNTNTGKRWNSHNAPLGTWSHQWQVANQGVWDQQWYPASGCQETGYSSTSLTYQMNWSQKTSWEVDAGFNFNIGKAASLNLGFSVTKSYSEGGDFQANIPAYSVGQVWTQKRMVWQNQQSQKCVRRHYGHNGLHCDAWGAYIHGDLVAKIPYNLGISIGSDHVSC